LIELEYKIIYKIDGDIPINPSWIGEHLNVSVQALQKKINKKNLTGVHKLDLKLPGGWALQSTSKKDLDSQKIPDIK